jgi:hypothetical protein
MTRKEILHQAEICVTGERQHDYGRPERNFRVIAGLWQSYLKYSGCVGSKTDVCICPEDVALMMCLFKIGRACTGDYPVLDNYVDLAGYAACAGELATGAQDDE